jgi:hypothetical protein
LTELLNHFFSEEYRVRHLTTHRAVVTPGFQSLKLSQADVRKGDHLLTTNGHSRISLLREPLKQFIKFLDRNEEQVVESGEPFINDVSAGGGIEAATVKASSKVSHVEFVKILFLFLVRFSLLRFTAKPHVAIRLA